MEKGGRKFHDAWAFILFVALTVALSTFYLYNAKPIPRQIMTWNAHDKLFSIIGINALFVPVMIAFSLLGTYFIPKFMIIASIVVLPAVTIFGWVQNFGTTTAHIIAGIVLLGLDLVYIVTATILVLYHLDYVAKMLSCASLIFFNNIGSVLAVCGILFPVFVTTSILPVFIDTAKINGWFPSLVEGLMATWKVLIMLYFLEVFMAVVVSREILKEKKIFVPAIFHSLLALGSIAYGALVLAIVITLRRLVSKEIDSRNSRHKPSFLMAILQIIAMVVLYVLEDIIRFANSIAMPYVGVHGTSYEEAVVKSYEVLSSSGLERVASLMGVEFTTFIISGMFWGFAFMFNYLMLPLIDPRIVTYQVRGWLSRQAVVAGIAATCSSFFFGIVFSLLRSAVTAVIFTMATMPDKTRQFNPEVYDAIQAKREYIDAKERAARAEPN